MAKILIIGDIYLETQYFVDIIPAEGNFSLAKDIKNSVGSKMINAARVFRKLGDEVHLFGYVGNDKEGEAAIAQIRQYDINDDLINKRQDAKTGSIVVITNRSGESAITLFYGVNDEITPETISSLKSELNKYDLIYTGTHLPLESLYTLCDICEEINIPLFLDIPNKQTELDLRKLQDVAFFSPNRKETEAILHKQIKTIKEATENILELRNKGILGNILITLDKDGCLLLRSGSTLPERFFTNKTECVDSTGSGDIFRAIFCSEFIKTKNWENSINKALNIATESIKTKGVNNTLESLNL